MIRLLTEALPILALPVLAQTGLPDPTSPAAIGWLLAGAFALVGMANQGMELWKKISPTKNPPDHETYASKVDLARVQAEHEKALNRIENRFEEWIEGNDRAFKEELKGISAWRHTQQEWMQTVERSLGRIEAKTDAIRKP
jgi:hypothetical protein